MASQFSPRSSRRTYIKSAAVVASFGAAGCVGGGNNSSGGNDSSNSSGGSVAGNANSGSETELTAGSELPKSHIMSEIVQEMVNEFNNKANNASMELLAGGALGADQAVAQLVKTGDVDVAYGNGAVYTYGGNYSFTFLPFVFMSRENFEGYLNSDMWKKHKKQILKNGNQHVVGVHGLGYRNVYATSALKVPEDGNSMTLRSPGAFEALLSEGLNVSTEVLPSGETYQSIETGLVDGMEAEAFTGQSLKLLEVCSHLSLTNHAVGPGEYVISNHVSDKLSQKDYDLLTNIYSKHVEKNRDRAWEKAQSIIDSMSENGITTVESNKQAFKQRGRETAKRLLESGQYSGLDIGWQEFQSQFL